MKIALFILIPAIGLGGCTIMGHPHAHKVNRPAVKNFSPELTRELSLNGRNRVAFAIAIDEHNRSFLLETDDVISDRGGLDANHAKLKPDSSLKDKDLVHSTPPNLSVKILTPEAEKELKKIGIKNVKNLLAFETRPMQFLSAPYCQCFPDYPQTIYTYEGGAECVEIEECGNEDEGWWHWWNH